mmetsp:Transcript_24115/g.36642  ORF Transcript_24115/g.36642 Transcript_24115/m.36642 type:complete len:216 (+) Transcript_24115:786-1433(+)
MYLRLIWGKRFVKNILHNDLFPMEQLGNKPVSQGTFKALLKTLSSDLIRFICENATIFNNDARVCYDRIIPGFSQLCCQSLGLPQKAAEFMLKFLLSAEYHVTTAYGTSAEYFSNLNQAIYGVLQGSGSAPAIWLAVSIILIRHYKSKFASEGISNPTRTDFITNLLDAFVNDTDLYHMVPEPTITTKELVKRMQQRAQTWEKALFATGGKLKFK